MSKNIMEIKVEKEKLDSVKKIYKKIILDIISIGAASEEGCSVEREEARAVERATNLARWIREARSGP